MTKQEAQSIAKKTKTDLAKLKHLYAGKALDCLKAIEKATTILSDTLKLWDLTDKALSKWEKRK